MSSCLKVQGLLAAGAMLAGGCVASVDSESAGEKVPPVENVAVGSEALQDSFTTDLESVPSVAYSTDRMMVVWNAKSGSNRLVVGQLFKQDGTPVGGSRVYVSNTHWKGAPKVASSGSQFFIVYEDEYSPADHDLLGILTDSAGAPISTGFVVDFSGSYDFRPQVAWVASRGAYLVAADRYVQGGPTAGSYQIATLGRYFLAPNTVQSPTQIVTWQPNVNGAIESIASGNGRIFATWSRDTYHGAVAFADAATLTLGVMTELGDEFSLDQAPRATYNSSNQRFGLAWRRQTSSGISNTLVRTFPSGCFQWSCANATQTVLTHDGNITWLDSPAIAPLGSNFEVTVGVQGYNVQNGKNLALVTVGSTGIPSQTILSVNAPCSGSQWAVSDQVAAVGQGSRVLVAYRPGCTSMAAIQALELTATAGHTFPVSTSLFPPQP